MIRKKMRAGAMGDALLSSSAAQAKAQRRNSAAAGWGLGTSLEYCADTDAWLEAVSVSKAVHSPSSFALCGAGT